MEETTQLETPSVRSAGIRYGLILGIVSILIFLVLVLSGADMTGNLRWISFPFYILLIVLAHKYYKDKGNGFMSYGEGMGITFWMGLISSAISSVFTFLYLKFIDASMIDMIREKQLEEFEKQGMSDAQIEQAMKFAEMFTSPTAMLIIGIIGGIIMLLICGLIVTIFTQKKNPQPTF